MDRVGGVAERDVEVDVEYGYEDVEELNERESAQR